MKKYSKCSSEVLGVSLFETRGSVSDGNATAVFRLYRKKTPITAVGMRHVLDANVSSCILVHAA